MNCINETSSESKLWDFLNFKRFLISDGSIWILDNQYSEQIPHTSTNTSTLLVMELHGAVFFSGKRLRLQLASSSSRLGFQVIRVFNDVFRGFEHFWTTETSCAKSQKDRVLVFTGSVQDGPCERVVAPCHALNTWVRGWGKLADWHGATLTLSTCNVPAYYQESSLLLASQNQAHDQCYQPWAWSFIKFLYAKLKGQR